MAYRRRHNDLSEFPLPWQIEWGLIGVATLAWIIGSVVWYFYFSHRLQAPMDLLIQIGGQPPAHALEPILNLAAKAAPFICLPFAYGIWKTTRHWLLSRLTRLV